MAFHEMHFYDDGDRYLCVHIKVDDSSYMTAHYILVCNFQTVYKMWLTKVIAAVMLTLRSLETHHTLRIKHFQIGTLQQTLFCFTRNAVFFFFHLKLYQFIWLSKFISWIGFMSFPSALIGVLHFSLPNEIASMKFTLYMMNVVYTPLHTYIEIILPSTHFY